MHAYRVRSRPAARADAARLELDLERTILNAPFSGVITGLDLNPGERVQAGETVCRLVDEVNISKGLVRVIVTIFGRETPVDMEYWQVEPV